MIGKIAPWTGIASFSFLILMILLAWITSGYEFRDYPALSELGAVAESPGPLLFSLGFVISALLLLVFIIVVAKHLKIPRLSPYFIFQVVTVVSMIGIIVIPLPNPITSDPDQRLVHWNLAITLMAGMPFSFMIQYLYRSLPNFYRQVCLVIGLTVLLGGMGAYYILESVLAVELITIIGNFVWVVVTTRLVLKNE